MTTEKSEAAKESPRQKSWWESAVIISSLTAIVTMVVTATAGFVTQRDVRKQEFIFSQRDAHLSQLRESIASIYELVASVNRATDERVKIAEGQYDALADAQLRSLVDELNRTDARWPREREISEMMVFLYYPVDSPVRAAWFNTKMAVGAFAACGESAYLKSQGTRAPDHSCAVEQREAEQGVVELRNAFVMEYNAATPKS